MPQPLGGPGVGLPYPQATYPLNADGAPVTPSTNNITLAPGQGLVIPAGVNNITFLDAYTWLQWLNPVTQQWTNVTNGSTTPTMQLFSDGVNYRLINLNELPVSGTVTGAGSGYVAGTTTITASTGASTWVAVVGGALNATVSVTAAGSGYGIAPLVWVTAPPSPGVAARLHATIANGTVNSIIVDVAGAGYLLAPSVVIQTCPFDPNLIAGSAITPATATCTLTGAGTLTAALVTVNGEPVGTTAPTLTVAGAGSSATATATLQSTIASISSIMIQPG